MQTALQLRELSVGFLYLSGSISPHALRETPCLRFYVGREHRRSAIASTLRLRRFVVGNSWSIPRPRSAYLFPFSQPPTGVRVPPLRSVSTRRVREMRLDVRSVSGGACAPISFFFATGPGPRCRTQMCLIFFFTFALATCPRRFLDRPWSRFLPCITPDSFSRLPSRVRLAFDHDRNLRWCVPSFAIFCPHPSLDQVMAGGPSAMEEMQKDPETAELLQKLEKAMGGIMP